MVERLDAMQPSAATLVLLVQFLVMPHVAGAAGG